MHAAGLEFRRQRMVVLGRMFQEGLHPGRMSRRLGGWRSSSAFIHNLRGKINLH